MSGNFRTFWRAVFAVLSAFFGVRGRKSADADSRGIRPPHVIVAGLLMLALFVGTLVLVVQSIV